MNATPRSLTPAKAEQWRREMEGFASLAVQAEARGDRRAAERFWAMAANRRQGLERRPLQRAKPLCP